MESGKSLHCEDEALHLIVYKSVDQSGLSLLLLCCLNKVCWFAIEMVSPPYKIQTRYNRKESPWPVAALLCFNQFT